MIDSSNLASYVQEIRETLTREQPVGFEKLKAKLEGFNEFDQKQFFYLFAICSRWFEKKQVTPQHLKLWKPLDHFKIIETWQWTHLSRLLLLLELANRNNEEQYTQLIKKLYDSADVNESILLIQSLAFIPNAAAFVDKAREAARSNITTLFSAIAHQTEYAYHYFDNAGWNQLVLKAAFLAVPIWSIYGLRKRNNGELATMLKDYARERQAAARIVPWDLWCCVAWSASTQTELEYLTQQLKKGDAKTQAAIALALTENTHDDAQQLGRQLTTKITTSTLSNSLNWQAISELPLNS